MLKGIIHTGSRRVLLLGLSAENIKRLQAGSPIFFEATDVPGEGERVAWDGKCDGVAIIAGEDEDAIAADVREQLSKASPFPVVVERAKPK